MLFVKSKNSMSLIALYSGLAIFIFSAFSLVIPSGYSYGPAFLLLGSLSIIAQHSNLKLNKTDWIFILVFFIYFGVHVALNAFFSLPIRSYDGFTRFLFAIPVYLLLILYPPRPIYFWLGLMIGTLGVGVFSIFQKYFGSLEWGRVNGYINAIQFGDISLLMASLLLCGVVWAIYSVKNYYLAVSFLLCSLLGFVASFLSLSRGGWLAIPIVLYVVYSILAKKGKRFFLIATGLACFFFIAGLALLSEESIIKQRLFQAYIESLGFFQNGLGAESTSLNTRFLMWKNGIDAFIERPILGWGDITAIKKHFSSPWDVLDSVDNFNHLHNEYLDTLAKNGLVGFIVLMMVFIFPLKYFLNLMKMRNKDSMAFAASGVLLVLCVMVFGLTQTFMAHISGITIFTFYLVIIKAYCRNAELVSNK